jgi:hypothetical protein
MQVQYPRVVQCILTLSGPNPSPHASISLPSTGRASQRLLVWPHPTVHGTQQAIRHGLISRRQGQQREHQVMEAKMRVTGGAWVRSVRCYERGLGQDGLMITLTRPQVSVGYMLWCQSVCSESHVMQAVLDPKWRAYHVHLSAPSMSR